MTDRREDTRRDEDKSVGKFIGTWWPVIMSVLIAGMAVVKYDSRIGNLEHDDTAHEARIVQNHDQITAHATQLAVMQADIAFIRQTVTSMDRRARSRGE